MFLFNRVIWNVWLFLFGYIAIYVTVKPQQPQHTLPSSKPNINQTTPTKHLARLTERNSQTFRFATLNKNITDITASHLTYNLSCPSFPLLPFFPIHSIRFQNTFFMVSLRHFDMAKKNHKNKTWKNKQIEKIGETIGILSITMLTFPNDISSPFILIFTARSC